MAAESKASGRNALNFWIDLVTAVAFAVLLGTSFIMKFILPPGTCDEVGKVKIWLGHSRHWWGDIHFWVAVLMLVLIVVHIWLHWSWVKNLWGKLLGRAYSPLSIGALVVMAGLMAVPFIVPYEYIALEDSDHSHVAEEAGAETVPASVAPCGVEGVSCDTCPAADDRLFGGGCGEEEVAEAEAAAAECEENACATCPNAESCGEEEEPVVEEEACDGSACSTCPNAESCGDDTEPETQALAPAQPASPVPAALPARTPVKPTPPATKVAAEVRAEILPPIAAFPFTPPKERVKAEPVKAEATAETTEEKAEGVLEELAELVGDAKPAEKDAEAETEAVEEAEGCEGSCAGCPNAASCDDDDEDDEKKKEPAKKKEG